MGGAASGGGFSAAKQVTAVLPKDANGVLGAVNCTATGQWIADGNYTDTIDRNTGGAAVR